MASSSSFQPSPGDLAENPVPSGGLVIILSIRIAKDLAKSKPKLHIFGDKYDKLYVQLSSPYPHEIFPMRFPWQSPIHSQASQQQSLGCRLVASVAVEVGTSLMEIVESSRFGEAFGSERQQNAEQLLPGWGSYIIQGYSEIFKVPMHLKSQS